MMQKLRDFNILMLRNNETKKMWEGLKQAAFDFCSVNYKIVMARNLNRSYPESWNIDQEICKNDFLNQLTKLSTVCENLGIDMPDFGAPEICRMTD